MNDRRAGIVCRALQGGWVGNPLTSGLSGRGAPALCAPDLREVRIGPRAAFRQDLSDLARGV